MTMKTKRSARVEIIGWGKISVVSVCLKVKKVVSDELNQILIPFLNKANLETTQILVVDLNVCVFAMITMHKRWESVSGYLITIGWNNSQSDSHVYRPKGHLKHGQASLKPPLYSPVKKMKTNMIDSVTDLDLAALTTRTASKELKEVTNRLHSPTLPPPKTHLCLRSKLAKRSMSTNIKMTTTRNKKVKYRNWLFFFFFLFIRVKITRRPCKIINPGSYLYKLVVY